MLRDAVVAFPVDLLVAGSVAAGLARRRPWEAPQVRAWHAPGTPFGRIAFQGALALAVLAPVGLLAQTGTERAIAGSGPGTPCPVGAPVKTFDVRALNVDIPLNRFGDHDPAGKMYALASMEAAIRAQEASRHVSIGLRDDPIQPLVIRDIPSASGDVVARCLALAGLERRVTADAARVRPKGSEVLALLCDGARARAALAWQPKSTLEDGLRQTIDWIRAHPDRYRPDEYAV
jgi:hypothetical protein